MKYTDKEHNEILNIALKWWNEKPTKKEDIYEYAKFQFRIKDFSEAVKWFQKAVDLKYFPAFYEYAFCLVNGLGINEDKVKAYEYFKIYLSEEGKKADVSENLYKLAMCYAYGFGVVENSYKARKIFECIKNVDANALYEMGIAYRDGRLGLKKDELIAEKYFLKAYDNYAEDAIFASYEMFQGQYEDYPYKSELTEAYSYRIGQYARVIHVNPTVQAYEFLARMYLNGFPGDFGESDARFKRKANKYLKKIEQLQSKKY